MGTNYYAVRNRPSVESPIHIGKSSVGWLFNFQAQNDTWREPPVVWNTINQVRAWVNEYVVERKEYVIMNEYDEIVPPDELFEMIENKQNDPFCKGNTHNFEYARNVDGYRFTDEEFS